MGQPTICTMQMGWQVLELICRSADLQLCIRLNNMQVACNPTLTDYLCWLHGSSPPAVGALEHQPVFQAVRNVVLNMAVRNMGHDTMPGQSGLGCSSCSLGSLEASQLAGSVALLYGGRPDDACARGGA